MVNVKNIWKKATSPQAKAGYKRAWDATSKGASRVGTYSQGLSRGLDSAMGQTPSQGGFRVPPGYMIKKTPKIIKTATGHIITYDIQVVKIGSDVPKVKRKRRKVVKKIVKKRKVKRRKKSK